MSTNSSKAPGIYFPFRRESRKSRLIHLVNSVAIKIAPSSCRPADSLQPLVEGDHAQAEDAQAE